MVKVLWKTKPIRWVRMVYSLSRKEGNRECSCSNVLGGIKGTQRKQQSCPQSHAIRGREQPVSA